jgi:transglutaminase-like putative cysteine protease
MQTNPIQRYMVRALFYEWQRRLTVFFVCILLYQYAVWFSEYWLDTTEKMIKYAFVGIFIMELIPRLHWTIRRLGQCAAIVGAHFYFLDYEPVWNGIRPIGALIPALWANMVQITPFIWFSLGLWLVYLVALWWVKAKLRIFLLIVGSVIIFGVVDSFSLHIFWDQVAFIIFSGLGLLIVHHFEHFRNHNPSSWEYFKEYPAMIATPIVLLIVVVMTAGVLAPNITPVITDPYTAWKSMKGEPVFTGGKGVVNVAGSAAKNASSGYSRDDAELGGGFDFDFTPVMEVDTTHSSYWRGETKSVYTGKGWERSESERNTPFDTVVSGADLPKDSKYDISQLQAEEVKATFTILKESYPVMFGAYSVQQVELPEWGENGTIIPVRWVPGHEELWWEKMGKEDPKQYSIVSRMPVIDVERMRASTEEPGSTKEFENYLQLPDSLPARVKQLALDLTQAEGNSYDKVKKIESYLRDNFPYNNKPDLSRARSEDFVDSFLFEVKEGYCDYYSTAMVVLTRSAGIPARWVKGYTAGDPPVRDEFGFIPQELLDLEGPGIYKVRNADAHSWVEVYFPGWGWIPFEPTAGFSLPTIESQAEASADFVAADEVDASDASFDFAVLRRWVPAAAAFVLLGFAAWYAIRRSRGMASFIRGLARMEEGIGLNRKVLVDFEKFLRYCRRKGFVRQEHETARETIRRWTLQNRWLEKDLYVLLALFEKAKYSRSDITDADLETSAKTIRRLREEM